MIPAVFNKKMSKSEFINMHLNTVSNKLSININSSLELEAKLYNLASKIYDYIESQYVPELAVYYINSINPRTKQINSDLIKNIERNKLIKQIESINEAVFHLLMK